MSPWLVVGLAAMATEPGDAEASSLPAQMHERFALITQARVAVQQDDLTGARAAAAQLVALAPPRGLTEPWRPYVVELKGDAARLAGATTRRDAAEQVAAIAITCAECHKAKGGGPVAPPLDAAELAGDRRRSAGLDGLWLSLITGDDAQWQRGATILSGDEQPEWPLVEASTPEERAQAFAGALLR